MYVESMTKSFSDRTEFAAFLSDRNSHVDDFSVNFRGEKFSLALADYTQAFSDLICELFEHYQMQVEGLNKCLDPSPAEALQLFDEVGSVDVTLYPSKHEISEDRIPWE